MRREARRLLNESLQLCLQLKDTLHLAQIYTSLAEVDLSEGAIDAAGQWLAQSMTAGAGLAPVSVDQVQWCWVAARLATAQQQYRHAATLFGLAEHTHSQIHHAIGGPMRALADAALATVQDALEPVVFAEAFAAGQRLSTAEALATFLVAQSNTAG